MNIIVCVKQVPGTTKVKINPETNTLIRQGIENIINPFDAYALEEGVRLKERFGGKVTVISMGPPQAEVILREAISCGADEAILIGDAAFAGSDTLATSYTLSRAIQKIKDYDLIICGRQTIDGDTAQVGPETAEALGIAFISYVSKVEDVSNGTMRVQRMIEEGHEIIEAPLPALITVVKEINV
ncbi:MAG TPA: electron transfer flavoprotein subunit beta/FixA family protein, partial [Dehalococcoidales bacterium]|nr:electron transfer flavoprotein subunit beta/FixA family protein [Dehalococcoidales bacterium]